MYEPNVVDVIRLFLLVFVIVADVLIAVKTVDCLIGLFVLFKKDDPVPKAKVVK